MQDFFKSYFKSFSFSSCLESFGASILLDIAKIDNNDTQRSLKSMYSSIVIVEKKKNIYFLAYRPKE